MKHSTSHRARLALIAFVAVLVTLAGSAAAARTLAGDPSGAPAPQTDRLRYVAETVAVPAVSLGSAEATCPEGTTAVEGGISSKSEPFTRVDVSTAAPDGSGWRVDLWNQHPSRSLTAHVWAGCVAVD